MIQKSYKENEYGKLFIIPTPIGNMDDITYRAISTLQSVDFVYAEDTRVCKILLSRYNIKKKVISCHKYSENQNKDKIVLELKNGKNIGYVSDRGTPLISDPGEIIVKYAIENDIQVVSLPGACAFLPALNMSGLNNDKFVFYGFLNSKSQARKEELKKLVRFPYTLIFYEAPHRFLSTIRDLLDILGNRKIAVCREISKVYEEVFRGNIKDVLESYSDIKGEIVIVIQGNNEQDEIDMVTIVKEFVNKGYKLSGAIKEVATIYGVSKNKLYEECKEEFL